MLVQQTVVVLQHWEEAIVATDSLKKKATLDFGGLHNNSWVDLNMVIAGI